MATKIFRQEDRFSAALSTYKEKLAVFLQDSSKMNLPALVRKAKITGLEELVKLTEMIKLGSAKEKTSSKEHGSLLIRQGEMLQDVVACLHSADLRAFIKELEMVKVKKFSELLKNVADAKDTYMGTCKTLSAWKALKYYEDKMISTLQDTDLQCLAKKASLASCIPRKVKNNIDLVDYRVPCTVVCRYLIVHINKAIENSYDLFEHWLNLVSKYRDSKVVKQVRDFYKRSLRISVAEVLKFDIHKTSSAAGVSVDLGSDTDSTSYLSPGAVRVVSSGAEALTSGVASILSESIPVVSKDDETPHSSSLSTKSNRKLHRKVTKIFKKFRKKSNPKPIPGTHKNLEMQVSPDTRNKTEEGIMAGMGCLAHNFCFEDQHISTLTEVLAPHSSRWKEIAISLQLPNNEIRRLVSMIHVLDTIGCLNEVLHIWVTQKYDHSKLPTFGSLESTLHSRTVGLGVEASNLQENLVKLGILSSEDSDSVHSESGSVENESTFIISQSCSSTIADGKCALFEVVVNASSETTLSYQWYKNKEKLDYYSRECVLCISDVDLSMEGSYTCEIKSSLGETLVSNPIILDVETPLDQYQSKLTDIYAVQPEVPVDTWPPVSSNTYINLALIKQQAINNAGEYARCTIRGDADDIFKDKVSIPYEKAFDSIGVGTRLLVEGRPGSGKTTLVHKVSQDWANNSIRFNCVRLLLLIHLHGFLSDPAVKLHNLLECYYEDDTNDIIQYAKKRSGLGLCFILDGLDEYLPQNDNAYIFKLIKRLELPRAIIIVASRPVAVAKFRDLAHTQIEVLGFLKDQISDYIGSFRFLVKSKRDELRRYLDYHPNVHHMCYLPIHAAMVCFLFDQCGNDLPETETGIYKEFTKYTLLRILYRYKKEVFIESIKSLSDTEKIPYQKICELAFRMTISSKQVMKHAEVKDFFDASSDKDSLGLITVDKLASRCGFQKLYTFLHLTFQEFLAACHITNLEPSKQVDVIQTYGKAEQMKAVWKFYCGLIEFDDQSINFEELMNDIQYGTLYKVQCSFESQQLSTCNSIVKKNCLSFKDNFLTPSDFTAIAYVVSSVSHNACHTLSFDGCTIGQEGIDTLVKKAGDKLSLVNTLCYHGHNCVTQQLYFVNALMQALPSLEVSDITNTFLGNDEVKALTDSFSHPNLQVVKIHSTGNNLSDDLLQEFVEYLKSHCSRFLNIWFGDYSKKYFASTLSIPFYFHCISGLSDVNMSNIQLQSILVKILSIDLVSSVCTNLSLVNCNIDDEGAEALSDGIKCSSIRALELSINLIGNDGALALASSIKSCLSLCKLNLSCNHIGDEGSMALVNAIKNCKEFELLLWNNNITKHCIDALLQIKNNVIIDTLDIESLGIGYNGVAALVSCPPEPVSSQIGRVDSNLSLHSLNLSSNNIGVCGTKILIISLRTFTNLQSLNLSHNNIGSDGAIALANALRHCHNLHLLDISENSIDCDGVKPLCDALECCSHLHTLDISYNNIGPTGTNFLSAYLMRYSDLLTLNLSGNQIGDSGAKSLAEALKSCSNMQTLDIHDNDIRYDGTMAVFNALQNCRRLNALELQSNMVNNHGIIALSNVIMACGNVISLSLNWSVIKDDGINSLANALSHCQCLTRLRLKENYIDRNAAVTLFKALQRCQKLQTLDVSYSIIGKDAAEILANAFKYCNDLQYLDISNCIDGDNIEAFAGIFKHLNHLQILNIHHNSLGFDGGVILADVLSHCNELDILELNIAYNNICEEGAKALSSTLKQCFRFRMLEISHNNIGKNGTQALAETLKNSNELHNLDISSNALGNDGVKALSDGLKHCTNLTTLNISNNHVSKLAFNTGTLDELFKQCIKLCVLNIDHNALHSDGTKSLTAALKHCHDLHTLSISHNNIADNGAESLSSALRYWGSLHTLYIDYNNIGDHGATILARELRNCCSNLHTLGLSGNNIGNDGAWSLFTCLCHCINLHTLDVSSNHIGKDGAIALTEVLKCCIHLHSLDFSYNNIQDCGVKAFAEYVGKYQLHTLRIARNHIGNDGAKCLSSFLRQCKNLRVLDVGYNDISEDGISALLDVSKQLNDLSIAYNNIGKDGAVVLADVLKESNDLRALNVSYNDIYDCGAEALAKHMICHCSHLYTLEISGNHISSVGAISLFGALSHSNDLHTLELSHNKIDVDGMRALCDVTRHCSNLNTLRMGCNNFGRDGAESLADVLTHCSNLQTLDIQYNSIYEDGAKALAVALKCCSFLHTLKIDGNGIGKEGMKALAEGLQNNNLFSLSIANNNISDDGVKFLSCLIKRNLHTLNVRNNNIGPDGATALSDGLKHCRNLTTFDLDNNHIGVEGATILADVLKHCTTLRTLNVRHCGIGYHGALSFMVLRNHFLTLDLSQNGISTDDTDYLQTKYYHTLFNLAL